MMVATAAKKRKSGIKVTLAAVGIVLVASCAILSAARKGSGSTVLQPAATSSALASAQAPAYAKQATAESRRRICMAHMVNSPEAVQWAADQGANGLEIDVNFDPHTNQATVTHHGGVNDCSFSIRKMFKAPPPICTLKRNPGKVSSPIVGMLQGIRHNAPDVALLFIDSKLQEKETVYTAQAKGTSIAQLLVVYLFQAGWKGNVVVCEGVSYSQVGEAYLAAAAKVFREAGFEGRAAFSFDYEAQKLKKGTPADCPKGYTNIGLTCARMFPPSSKGERYMSCKPQHVRRGTQCYYEPQVI